MHIGLKTLRWLTEQQTTEKGHLRPIGSNGFYHRGGARANFDQQPIEAQATVAACLEAYRATADVQWYEQAQRAFDWFIGGNDLGLELYVPETGGCRDGLHVDRVNGNQGAESTLAFLLSLAEMRQAQDMLASFPAAGHRGGIPYRSSFTPRFSTVRNRPSNGQRNRAGTSSDTFQNHPEARSVAGSTAAIRARRCASAFAGSSKELWPSRRGGGALLEQVYAGFAQRHLNLQQRFLDRFEQLRALLPAHAEFSNQRRLLIGSYFLAEYALESAALFSPSMVPHPDQTGLPEGAVRFVLSLRATGEGHISSITFRCGVIHRDLRIEVDAAAGLLTEPQQIANTVYEGPLFQRKLWELGLQSDFTARVLERLGSSFGLDGLREALEAELQHSGQAHGEAGEDQLRAQSIWMLARSNYEVQFAPRAESFGADHFSVDPFAAQRHRGCAVLSASRTRMERMRTMRPLRLTMAG